MILRHGAAIVKASITTIRVIIIGRMTRCYREAQMDHDGHDSSLMQVLTTLRSRLDDVIGAVSASQRMQIVLHGVAQASHLLLVEPDVNAGVAAAVELLGTATGVDGVAVFRHDPMQGRGAFIPYAAWPRQADQPADVLHLSQIGAQDWLDSLERGAAVRVRTADQPDHLRAWLEEHQATSILFVPVPGDVDYWGTLVFNSSDSNYAWSAAEEQILYTMAAGIGGALARQRAAQRELDLQRALLEARQQESLILLARGVAHDFNNVLQILRSALESLEAAPSLAPQMQSDLKAAHRAIDRATELVRQLHIYAGQATPRSETVHLGTVIDDTVQLVQSLLPPTITLHVDVDPDLPAVSGDPTQLGQVLMNLLVNAGEAIGADPCEIEIAARPVAHDPSCVELVVRDSGPGLDEWTHARLFEPFFSTKGDGRGLGLAAVLGIVRAHAGTIEVTSAPGRGTTFRILLPAQSLKRTV
jgi:signal transduction histidine kinase